MNNSENTSNFETKSFKAEVKQVLDIVIHSLYTHREIFLRELISNASDALEKMRHNSLVNENYADKGAPLDIRIVTDKNNHTLSITDTGIGMNHEELIGNLGTIARSGTREYLENISSENKPENELIGKFGVGFYSSFMAAREVSVKTKSFVPDSKSFEWNSEGISKYTIKEIENNPRGTTVTVFLRDDANEFENPDRIKEIIRKYSNFVPFPIYVDGEKVNTVQALWAKSSSEVNESEYKEFFRFLVNTEDDPSYWLHISTDVPLEISSILYMPANNPEKLGFFKLKPSISLYCKKILVQQQVEKLLPEYMRFISGVLDSSDLPLNISRETLQDNMVYRKIGKFLTKRVFKFLEEESEKDTKKYTDFWDKFGIFIKEGIITDFENRAELSRLLRFQTSKTENDNYISLSDYIKRMKEGQNEIYYLHGRSKDDIENGPYMENFKKLDIEVIYLYDPMDDFVMTTIGEFEEKKIIGADSANVKLPEDGKKPPEKEPDAIPEDEIKNFLQWAKETLGEKVTDVRETKRNIDRPAIIVNPDDYITTGMRKIMRAAGRDLDVENPKVLELDIRHPIIQSILKLRDGKTDKGFLQSCVEQIYENALAESGLLDEPRNMVKRIYLIMEKALKSEENHPK